MDTAWIQVFVLVFSQCAAPPGKTVCQEEEIRYQFSSRDDCEQVLEQFVAHSDNVENVIVNKERSRCLPTLKSQQVFSSLERASEASANLEGWGELPVDAKKTDFIQKAHDERLDDLFECDATGGVAPCKMGDIIVEGASANETEVWKRQQ
jgi:hypothetical protein